MTSPLTLYGLAYSPWTERARWALDLKNVSYRYREHSPYLGEYALRFRARRLGRVRATVPLLVGPDVAIGDSFEIMQYADEVGVGDTLLPDPAEVQSWRDKIEPALEKMRVRVSQGILGDPAALKEAAAAAAPAFMAGLLKPVAAIGVKFFARKYDFALDAEAADEALIRSILEDARRALNEDRYILTTFSIVDIMVATLLQAVTPVDDTFVSLGPATRGVWHHASLAADFPELIAWRDALYRTHRRAEASR